MSALPRLVRRFNVTPGAGSDYRALFAAAADGDAAAMGARDHSIRSWSAHVVSLIHVFDPTRVVLGGGIMAGADHILTSLRQYVSDHAWTPWGSVEIVPGSLADAAALLGCEALVQETLA